MEPKITFILEFLTKLSCLINMLRFIGLFRKRGKDENRHPCKKASARSLFFFLRHSVLKRIPGTYPVSLVACLFLLIIPLSGCANLDPYLSHSQEMWDDDRRILAGLLRSPEGNFEAVRAIAFRHNPDVKMRSLEIVAYYKSSVHAPIPGRDYYSTARDVFSFATELLHKVNPGTDPVLRLKVAAFERAKLEVSQKLAASLAELAQTGGADSAIEKKITRFFEARGFAFASDKEKEKEAGRREKIVRTIYETCGLVKEGD